MKKLLLILSVCFIGCFDNKETTYCGQVTEMYRTSAGYKIKPENHIVFYCEELKRNIDVKITSNTYVNTSIGKTICFNLREYDLKQ